MGEVKKLCMEAESMLVTCLDDYGMTNMQALEHIRKNLGLMAYEHAKDTLNRWNDEDKDE